MSDQKPNPHDPKLVGHQEVFKYIGIHGYDKFQVDQRGVVRDGTSIWIKDACRKDTDPDYAMLTMRRRYLLDALRRLRGLHGKNPLNHPLWVCRALAVSSAERGCIPADISTLVGRGLLVLTNEPLHFEEVIEVVEVKEKKHRKVQSVVVEPSAPPGQRAKQSSSPPVSPVHRQQSKPAAPAPVCGCGYAETHGKPCPYCGKSVITAPRNAKVARPAASKPKRQLGFDPYSVEPFDDWTAEEITLVVCYWWEHAKNTWYRDNVNRLDYFHEKFPKMAGEMPHKWQPPKASAPKQADPACSKCHGTGQYKEDKPGYPKGMFFQLVICPCTPDASISPAPT